MRWGDIKFDCQGIDPFPFWKIFSTLSWISTCILESLTYLDLHWLTLSSRLSHPSWGFLCVLIWGWLVCCVQCRCTVSVQVCPGLPRPGVGARMPVTLTLEGRAGPLAATPTLYFRTRMCLFSFFRERTRDVIVLASSSSHSQHCLRVCQPRQYSCHNEQSQMTWMYNENKTSTTAVILWLRTAG